MRKNSRLNTGSTKKNINGKRKKQKEEVWRFYFLTNREREGCTYVDVEHQPTSSILSYYYYFQVYFFFLPILNVLSVLLSVCFSAFRSSDDCVYRI